ncbi:MAG TPA: hypothetical protein VKB46_24615, partial [Pyrinomonadaceae bacterium]|nr:hypothetical protein [Pyrinomonadaceae bacterium]
PAKRDRSQTRTDSTGFNNAAIGIEGYYTYPVTRQIILNQRLKAGQAIHRREPKVAILRLHNVVN